ncbi:MAG TPA: ABC transporter permease [Steroidobacteraceae bacterium]|nr:ABC transporter permease [Steroidobacteraceae bacterium]
MLRSSPTIAAINSRPWKEWLGRPYSIAFRLAWRNITRDQVRLVIAVVGVAFAVLLMTLQMGLLIGFATTSSSLIDRAKADLWIAPRGAKDVDQAGQIPERQKFLALGTQGVTSVESLIVRFAVWKRPDGGAESVIIVGIDPSAGVLQPWNFVAGTPATIGLPEIVIDKLYSRKLGVTQIGQTVEIMGRRARVVGFTSGIRTFTQSPYVFTSLSTARTLSGVPDEWTTYFLVRAERGANLSRIRTALQLALPSTDVWTSKGFSWQTRVYWLLTTGAGSALLLAAVLGLVVGLVIVSQTLYSATVERQEEYATIRAMGASDRYLKSIILQQALVSGALGYILGTAAALMIAWIAQGGSAALLLSYQLILALGVVTLTMCVAASLLSIRKVLSVDAASVFR